MHQQPKAQEIMARYPDLPEQHAVFMAGLYSDIQAKISEFRVSQMEKITEDNQIWQADLALAKAAANLQGFIAEIMDKSYRS